MPIGSLTILTSHRILIEKFMMNVNKLHSCKYCLGKENDDIFPAEQR